MGFEVFENYECDGQLEISDCSNNRKLTHLSLFSGIGGLDLAAEWAGFESVGQCEWADYPTKVLEKHWPDVPRWRDIHGLSADEFVQRTGIGSGELTCISGGFPCQPHSVAGLRKASCDERDLWPEYRRVVSEIKPKWVVAENVRGLFTSESGRFFRGILRDFADMGYDAGWCCYRAADVGTIHARERVAIIAHSNSEFGKRVFSGKCKTKDGGNKIPGFWSADRQWVKQRDGIVTVLPMGGTKLIKPLISRGDDGFSGAMDRNKCLGNAVVPQQFYPVFKAIADIENR